MRAQELIVSSECKVNAKGVEEVKQVLIQFFQKYNFRIAENRSNPFGADNFGSIKLRRDTSRRAELDWVTKLKALLGITNKSTARYMDGLKRTKNTNVEEIHINLQDIEGDQFRVVFKAVPAIICKAEQLDIGDPELSDFQRSLLLERSMSLLEKAMSGIHAQVTEEPGPMADEIPQSFVIPVQLANELPEDVFNHLKQAQECAKSNLWISCSVMIAKTLEKGLGHRYEQEGNSVYDEDGNPTVYLPHLIKWYRDWSESPNKVLSPGEGDYLNWARKTSMHYTEGVEVRQERIPRLFNTVKDVLEDLYCQT